MLVDELTVAIAFKCNIPYKTREIMNSRSIEQRAAICVEFDQLTLDASGNIPVSACDGLMLSVHLFQEFLTEIGPLEVTCVITAQFGGE